MKKIVRLTESDLVRLVNKVINEQSLDTKRTEAKRIAKQIKDGVGSFGNTNIETLRNGLYSLENKDNSIVGLVYKELGITSLVDYLDDEFMGYSLTKGLKNDPIGDKIFNAMGGKDAATILDMAKRLDVKYRSPR